MTTWLCRPVFFLSFAVPCVSLPFNFFLCSIAQGAHLIPNKGIPHNFMGGLLKRPLSHEWSSGCRKYAANSKAWHTVRSVFPLYVSKWPPSIKCCSYGAAQCITPLLVHVLQLLPAAAPSLRRLHDLHLNTLPAYTSAPCQKDHPAASLLSAVQ